MGEPDAGEALTAPAREVPWSALTRAERFARMQLEVMPKMRDLFQAYDPDAFADFSCKTCHGEDAEAVDFAMPNGLDPLNPDHLPNPYQGDEAVARLGHFMRDQVMLGMAEIMNAPLFDPATGEGFGCFSCHEQGGATSDHGVEDPPAVSWAAMDHDQRHDYMRNVVSPAMKELFQEFDPEEFAEFGCKTCHGENAREVAFEMPNGIAPLDFGALDREDPATAHLLEFMGGTVVPKMVELLDTEPYDRETGAGFGCSGCHGLPE